MEEKLETNDLLYMQKCFTSQCPRAQTPLSPHAEGHALYDIHAI